MFSPYDALNINFPRDHFQERFAFFDAYRAISAGGAKERPEIALHDGLQIERLLNRVIPRAASIF